MIATDASLETLARRRYDAHRSPRRYWGIAFGAAIAFMSPVLAKAPETNAATGIDAAAQVLQHLGVARNRLDLRLTPAATPFYQVQVRGGRLRVEGSSPVALVRGTYAYLNRLGRLSVSWEGDRTPPLGTLADYRGPRVESLFLSRAYLNTCTYGYTTPWWGWARWEREIDWMAAHGVDMPLALEGQEYVWRALWREQGLDDATIGRSLSGAPFLPWQRMGNIEGYRAPLQPGWIEKKHQLQIRILTRMRALGMTPILPAFAGYVPKAFADRHPEARIYRMRAWEGFHETYWLDPSDPLFAKLAARFIQLYTATYGAGDHYLADAFNEMVPPIADDGSDARSASYGDSSANKAPGQSVWLPTDVRDRRLAAYGERLYRSITAAAPGATWVMQGWLFGADKKFWTPDAIAAFLSRVPAKGMLILDIGNDRYPGVWRDTQAFDGKPWVYGYVHNYGGSNPVYGDLQFYRDDIGAVIANPARGRLSGFGLFPEGLHTNSVVYEEAYDLAWSNGGASLDDWLTRYTRARYGRTFPAILAAWRDVVAGAYQTRYWTPRWWKDRAGAYLFFKRPSLDGDLYPDAPGDPATLRKGLDALLGQAPLLRDAPLYRFDLVEFTRHYASLRLDDALRHAIAAYKAGDVAAGDASAAQMRRLALAIDHLIGAQPESLASWITDARGYADTPAEAKIYMTDAKAQVTIWGGDGNLGDYASKAWAGMYAHYYLPRWMLFLDALRAAAVAGKPLDEAATRQAIIAWERAWVADDAVYRRTQPKDPVGEARALMQDLERP
jgi:alpha-N-acetylglucosaminidase